MKIRLFEPNDLNTIIDLFIETVHEVNQRDYSSAHVNAWAPKDKNHYSNWADMLTANTTLVVNLNQKIVGFGTLTHEGVIHLLYIHKEYLRQGIAAMLLQALEQAGKDANLSSLSVNANITSKPFFIKKGYSLITEHYVSIDPLLFIQYKMKKQL
jgi:putative acetyltransferase